MGEALEKTDYTVEDYIAIERESLEKMEYFHGEIFAMAGGSLNHSLLSSNMNIALGNAIKNRGNGCRTYNSDAKIAISRTRFVYPDTFVVCGKTETFDIMPDAASNPLIIVEVQSPSTGLYDREGKFQAYRQIKSFREYVLISQDKILVEVFYKPDDKDFWQYRSYDSLDETVQLNSIDSGISITEIYAGWESEGFATKSQLQTS